MDFRTYLSWLIGVQYYTIVRVLSAAIKDVQAWMFCKREMLDLCQRSAPAPSWTSYKITTNAVGCCTKNFSIMCCCTMYTVPHNYCVYLLYFRHPQVVLILIFETFPYVKNCDSGNTDWKHKNEFIFWIYHMRHLSRDESRSILTDVESIRSAPCIRLSCNISGTTSNIAQWIRSFLFWTQNSQLHFTCTWVNSRPFIG